MSSHKMLVLGFNTLARKGLKLIPTTPKDVVSLPFNRRRPVVDNGTGYRGEAESEEAFAQQYVEDCGLLNDLPESLRGYFDYEAYGRDMFMDGYVLLDGHVFSR